MLTLETLFTSLKHRIKRIRKKYWAWLFLRNTSVTVHGKIKVLAPHRIQFGNNCYINENVLIDPGQGLHIGNNVVISPYVKILGSDLDYQQNIMHHISGEIVIGDNVWIGAGSIILKNIRIGKGSVVGAGAVVTRDVPEYVVVAGNPARIIKHIKDRVLNAGDRSRNG